MKLPRKSARKFARKPAGRPQPQRSIELTVTKIGHRGDGVAQGADGSIYVPLTLPGERIRALVIDGRGVLEDILEPSPDRVEPVCSHFGACGGCMLQHWARAPYLAWKHDQVVGALRQQALEVPVAPVVATSVAGRRRAVLAAGVGKGGLRIGYHARASHEVVDIAECPILVPQLQGAIAPLRALLRPVVGGRAGARIELSTSQAGLDVVIDGAATPDDARVLMRLTTTAAEAGIVRLTMNGECLLSLAEPTQDIGGTPIVPPPGGFLQASREAEDVLWRLVQSGVGKVRRAADLFSGVGTFALRLAREAQVTAVESDALALASLARAARQPGLKTITPLRRDLFADPLLAEEMKGFDAVVFDPPFAGAAAQASQLAGSRVARIVAVSCNPATFARDARTLVDGGYRLEQITPVDQFVFSPHIEVVGHFTTD